eukprot:TRINITY_DN4096_c0_g1_i1.p1 TRINITY_DN4096_c0_g1~~TRINITY_DN4096_c0_g1_i1.p1  ORF type:complete len:344 (-),score=43.72 TRINITY_DN4096_c0_g1_i1:220-1251(-)
MGMCMNKQFVDQRKQAREIEDMIKAGREDIEDQFTLLLLGTGDSGKSTFCKQMRFIHNDTYTEREIYTFRAVLLDGALTYMQKILHALGKKMDSNENAKEVLKATELSPKIASNIKELWKESSVKEVVEQNTTLHLPSAVGYYFDNVERFAEDNFIPSEEDLIRARAQTTGISEILIDHKSCKFKLVDVGGQRSERRKWLHCFDGVTSVIYLAALDEYNLILQEDDKTNRMDEALSLFQEVSGSTWFKGIPFVLFLNKSDIFKKKITTHPLNSFFSDITEDDAKDYEKSVQYIRSKYEEVFAGSRLYVFTTCAIERNNVSKVFDAVQDSILSAVIREQRSGLI